MKPLTKHLIPGLAALLASAPARASHRPPPPGPPTVHRRPGQRFRSRDEQVVRRDKRGRRNLLRRSTRHSDQLLNNAGRPNFRAAAGTQIGGTVARSRRNRSTGAPRASIPGVTLVGDQQGLAGYRFGVRACLVHADPAGGPVSSSLGPVCWIDGRPDGTCTSRTATPPPQRRPASSPASPRRSRHRRQGHPDGYFNITNAAPGDATVTATVNLQDLNDRNNSTTKPVGIPGVTVRPDSHHDGRHRRRRGPDARTIVNPEVLGRRGAPGAPPRRPRADVHDRLGPVQRHGVVLRRPPDVHPPRRVHRHGHPDLLRRGLPRPAQRRGHRDHSPSPPGGAGAVAAVAAGS